VDCVLCSLCVCVYDGFIWIQPVIGMRSGWKGGESLNFLDMHRSFVIQARHDSPMTDAWEEASLSGPGWPSGCSGWMLMGRMGRLLLHMSPSRVWIPLRSLHTSNRRWPDLAFSIC